MRCSGQDRLKVRLPARWRRAAAVLATVGLVVASIGPRSVAAQGQLVACPPFTAEAMPPEANRHDPNAQYRLAQIAADIQSTPHRVLFLGDSLTQRWPLELWDRFFAPLGSVNAGIDGDRTDHLLSRIRQLPYQNTPPSVVVLLIGTNDLGHGRSAVVAAEGARRTLVLLRELYPTTRILLLGLLPRWDRFGRHIAAVNRFLKTCDGGAVAYRDIGARLLDQGQLSRAISPDGVHLSEAGYRRVADALRPLLAWMLGDRPAGSPPRARSPAAEGAPAAVPPETPITGLPAATPR